MFSEEHCGKNWNCPTDRELALRAKLNAGWSIHTANVFRKIEVIQEKELQIIEDVIQRAGDIEKIEVERVGRMLCRLENMTKNTRKWCSEEDGRETCSMCGTAFGFFSSFVSCVDCDKAVCEKCRVDTLTSSSDFCVLCKICSENREVWKKSGGWFYGKFPTMTEACQKECIAQTSGSPGLARAYDTWAHRTPEIVRLQSFEPPEENHNDHSQYKDWTLNVTANIIIQERSDPSENDNNSQHTDKSSSKLDLIFRNEDNGYDIDDDDCLHSKETLKKSFNDLHNLSMNYLTVCNTKLSTSCPDLQETSKLRRKPSIRRKKAFPINKRSKELSK